MHVSRDGALENMLGAKKGPAEDSSSKIIINNNGRGPLHHFIFPLGGLKTSRNESLDTATQNKRSSTRKSTVPDVLPIRLGSGKEMPLNAASPKFGKKVTTSEMISVDAVAPMPFDGTAGEE